MFELEKELHAFKPIDLKSLEAMNLNMTEEEKSSILSYNKALENLIGKSEDIAVMNLRRAITQNQEFAEAKALLGIYHVSEGDFDKAEELFVQLRDLDKDNAYALRFFEEMKSFKPGIQVKKGRPPVRKKTEKSAKKTNKSDQGTQSTGAENKSGIRVEVIARGKEGNGRAGRTGRSGNSGEKSTAISPGTPDSVETQWEEPLRSRDNAYKWLDQMDEPLGSRMQNDEPTNFVEAEVIRKSKGNEAYENQGHIRGDHGQSGGSATKKGDSLLYRSALEKPSGRRLKKVLLSIALVSLVLAILFSGFKAYEYFMGKDGTLPEGTDLQAAQNQPDDIAAQSIRQLEDKFAAQESTNKILTDQLSSQKKETEALSGELSYYKSVASLLDIESMNAKRNYEGAGDKLLELKSAGFKGIEKEKYDVLCKDIYPRAAWAVYTQGNSLYESRNFKDSATKLAKVLSYAAANGTAWEYIPLCTYQLAMCYKETGDRANASAQFNDVISKYPTSEYAQFSKSRLSELGAVQ